MRNARDVRALIERRRAERGAVLTDQEWERIARIVDAAAPIPDDAFHHLTSLLRPLLPLAAPLAEPPATRTCPSRPRSRRRAGHVA